MLNRFKKPETWENIAIILSIISLWPTIYLSRIKKVDFKIVWVKPYKILLVAIILVLLIVFVRRIGRMSTAFHENRRR
jgi:hypothetical protein